MFTGIINGQGVIKAVRPVAEKDDMRLSIAPDWATLTDIVQGASIACNGCCLTVIEKEDGLLSFNVSAETLAHTTLGTWRPGDIVNLERALRTGDELGGHLVSGHVDGTGLAVEQQPAHGSVKWIFEAPQALAKFIAVKGSIAIDGVSLTVNEVDKNRFSVNIIPHTAQVTGFCRLTPGDKVNLEADIFARYIGRMLSVTEDTAAPLIF